MPDKLNAYGVLKVIPRDHLRDHLLFRLLAETGLRISEALQFDVDDLDLTPDETMNTCTSWESGGSAARCCSMTRSSCACSRAT